MKCRLCESRTRAVPGEGPLLPPAMLVGQAPGRAEDVEGRPFVVAPASSSTTCEPDRIVARSSLPDKQREVPAAAESRPRDDELATDLFNDLPMERTTHPLKPLFEGRWQ
jgi:hypothetical protein